MQIVHSPQPNKSGKLQLIDTVMKKVGQQTARNPGKLKEDNFKTAS